MAFVCLRRRGVDRRLDGYFARLLDQGTAIGRQLDPWSTR